MPLLFNPKLLNKEIEKNAFLKKNELTKKMKIIKAWQKAIRDHDLERTKEKTVQGAFLEKIFNRILGYTTQTDGYDEWYMIQHPKTEVDAKEADGSLGFFTKKEKMTRAVIELKDAKSPLDKKQSSRKEKYTPIEQAYLYATKFDQCDWIIVSNFREIRLFHKSRTSDYYEKFDFLKLDNEKDFKRFFFLLNSENLLDRKRNSLLDQLVKDTSHEEEKITNRFYDDYSQMRHHLFTHLQNHNPDIAWETLLEKAQKILDRLIFIFFCEDRIKLLPEEISLKTYQRAKASFSPSDERIWNEFKGLFLSIDKGNDRVSPKINAYNGGLFAEDSVLDSLHIKDGIWDEIIKLSNYDFESDLNVNILGHIFEQSISDIEKIKGHLAEETGAKKSKRKKQGIYYTPEKITEYIVEQTLGRFLEENPDQLEKVKVLDPACGSGAFLNQAHTLLEKEWKAAHEEGRIKAKEADLGALFDYNPAANSKDILLNNLFGVDLNPESVEITKLALWLKTANSKQKLQKLDKNIKCGNSLISDNRIDEMAFDWHKEFKSIMASGGFDIVIGNPPYVRQELLPSEQKEYLMEHYSEVSSGVADLYVYFFEKGISLLKENGYFGFIVSNKFLRADYGKKLLKYIKANTEIVQLIDFGDLQLFEGATTYPCIIILKKTKVKDQSEFPFLNLSKHFDKPHFTDLSVEIEDKGFEVVIKPDDDKWVLENPKEKRILEKMKKNGIPLGDYVDGKIYYGIKTGYNKAFIIDKETREELIEADPKSDEIIKPVLEGKEIKRYFIDWQKKYIIVTKNGFNIPKRFPAIFEYLSLNEVKLKNRYDQGECWYNLRSCNYYDEFDKNKIIFPDISKNLNFAFDDNGFYLTNTGYFFPNDSKTLLTILNSKIILFFFSKYSSKIRGGYYRFIRQYVQEIPVIAEEISSLYKASIDIENKKFKIKKTKSNALQLLETTFKPKKITKKLKSFERLGWNEFYEEMKKKCTGKYKITLSKAKELQEFFILERDAIVELEEAIKKQEAEIDETVYDMYGLTEDEKRIIRNYQS